MRVDQIAYFAHSEAQATELKKQLGLAHSEWIEDIVEGDVYLPQQGTEGISRGHLRFCYDYSIEVEILTYLGGPHWHQGNPDFLRGSPFLSHVGVHCEQGEAPFVMAGNMPLVQQMQTFKHSNPYLIERQRTYNYLIYDTRPLFGHHTKFIYRKEPGDGQS